MPELGNKYECYSCGAKFYDLGKPQPICPKCGANQKDAAAAAKAAHETATHRRRRKEEVVRTAGEEGEAGEHHRPQPAALDLHRVDGDLEADPGGLELLAEVIPAVALDAAQDREA